MSPRTLRTAVIAAVALAASLPAGAAAKPKGDPDRGPKAGPRQDAPLVIGHRGASGYRPEHTLASYALAARLGADFIEPDLVSTKDGVLVARHENEISGTTDVAAHPEFASRKTTKTIDGVQYTGWFTEDFTLRELKTLTARERLPQVRPQNTRFDGFYEVPTFQEVIDLSRNLSAELGRPIGIYPETKHPTYHDSIGLSLEEPLVRTLKANGLNDKRAKVFVQSFEVSNLRELSRRLRVPLVQLTGATGAPADFVAAGDPRTYRDITSKAGLREVARYADAVGPDKTQILPRNPDGSSAAPTSLVDDAHAAGLIVHPYTFRRENQFLPLEFRSSADGNAVGDLQGEIRRFLALGIDGFFTDNPDIGRQAVDAGR
jgi:glycerophosphoryl diester phosphodiesterase